MATLTNINLPNVKPLANPLTNVMAAAADQFAAEFGATYLLRFTNGSATPGNVVINDPTAVDPGSATLFDPDVTVALAASPSVRSITVQANRFRDANGNIAWTYSANMSNAASLVEIYRVA